MLKALTPILVAYSMAHAALGVQQHRHRHYKKRHRAHSLRKGIPHVHHHHYTQVRQPPNSFILAQIVCSYFRRFFICFVRLFFSPLPFPPVSLVRVKVLFSCFVSLFVSVLYFRVFCCVYRCFVWLCFRCVSVVFLSCFVRCLFSPFLKSMF